MRHFLRLPLLPLLLAGPIACAGIAAAPAAAQPVVADGKQVSLEYTLTLEDGSTADTNVGKAPLVFVMGSGRVLPALEAQLVGLGPNDTMKIGLSAEQGYGPVREDAFSDVDASMVPDDARQVGAMLFAQDAQGRRFRVRVHAVTEEKVTLDYNHPLAGKALNFDVKVLGIEDPPSAPEAAGPEESVSP